jgi:hypothetical protein
MAVDDRVHSRLSGSVTLFLRSTAKQLCTVATLFVFAVTTLAQEPAIVSSRSGSQDVAQTADASTKPALSVPAGTKIPLVLTHAVDSKSTHRGDEIDAQITFPVTVGKDVVIPQGTFLKGNVEKLVRKGSRSELQMQSASVIFPNGYIASLSGPANIETDEWTAVREPGKGAMIGAFVAPAVGSLAGALIGHAASSPGTTINGLTDNSSRVKDTAIGGIVGLAVGGVISIALLLHSHQFLVDVGSPMELVLQQPLLLNQDQVADAVHMTAQHPVVPMAVAKRPQPPAPPMPTDTGTCYTPETPGTPPTVIPGTPPIGDSPGTPDIVIPGTPATPGTPYPCP